MPLSSSILSNTQWHKLSLKFKHARLEAHYKHYIFPRLIKQSRLALLLGAMMYEIYGILDFMLVPKEILSQIATIRVTTTFTILLIYGLTFFKGFKKFNQHLLIFVLLLASLGLLWKMILVDSHLFPYYFSGLLLLIFWIHAFSILNFKYAFFCTLTIVLLSTVCFFYIFSFHYQYFKYQDMLSYIFILISAFGVSAFASYLSEKQERALFLREKELDRERYIQRERALHDYLTKLPNRALLLDRVDQAIHESKRNFQMSAGFFIDLDDFKKMNDTYGHAIGDAVLIEVSARLKAAVRAADTVARLSGDEFFVLARDIKNSEQAHLFANKILNLIKQPYICSEHKLDVLLSASIGICLFPYQGVTALHVIDKADQAMYQIKLAQKSGIAIAKTAT